MDIMSLLDEELVLTNMQVTDAREAICILGELLQKRGLVEEGFVQAVLDREEEFPTGLATQDVQIALPHTEAKHVRTSKMVIGVLDNPVPFKKMGAPGETVEAKEIFLLAIGEHHSQVQALQQLATLFQDGSTLKMIASAPDAESVLKAVADGVKRNSRTK
jgi:PTS system galactitol-specific IIA component